MSQPTRSTFGRTSPASTVSPSHLAVPSPVTPDITAAPFTSGQQSAASLTDTPDTSTTAVDADAASTAAGTSDTATAPGAAHSDTHFRQIRVLVVDDQAMVRGAIAALLSLEPDIEVVGQAGDGAQALEVLKQHPVDVVLMDVEMPRMDGITACSAIRSTYRKTRVLMLTAFGRPGYVQRTLDAGASGFIVKDTPADQLAQAVRQVAAGERVIDPQLAVETLSRGASPLTDREADVLRVAAGGGTVADVAKALGLSAGTVRNHISAAMMKTEARTRSEAARIATESGWL